MQPIEEEVHSAVAVEVAVVLEVVAEEEARVQRQRTKMRIQGTQMKVNKKTTAANPMYNTRMVIVEEEAEEAVEAKEEAVVVLEVTGQDILEEGAFAFKKKATILGRMLALKMDQHQEDEVEAEDSEAALEEVSLEVGVVSEVEEVAFRVVVVVVLFLEAAAVVVEEEVEVVAAQTWE